MKPARKGWLHFFESRFTPDCKRPAPELPGVFWVGGRGSHPHETPVRQIQLLFRRVIATHLQQNLNIKIEIQVAFFGAHGCEVWIGIVQ
jgi:hypothetical protein